MTDFLRQFRTRRLLCSTLADFTRRQQTLLAAGEDEALVELLGRKGRVLRRLAESGGDAARAEWRSVRDFLDPDTRAECDRLLDECERQLADILDSDQAAIAAATNRRDQTRGQLRSLADSADAAAGYEATPHLDTATGLNTATGHPRLNLVSG